MAARELTISKVLKDRLNKLIELRKKTKDQNELSKIDKDIELIESFINERGRTLSLKKLYKLEYSQMQPIGDFLEIGYPLFFHVIPLKETYNFSVPRMDDKEIFDLINEFYYQALDDTLYKTFKLMFDQKDKLFHFGTTENINDLGETIYLSSLREPHMFVYRNHSIEDFATIAHEYGHGLEFLQNETAHAIQNPNYLLIEIISFFFEILSVDFLKKFGAIRKNCMDLLQLSYTSTIFEVQAVSVLKNLMDVWEKLRFMPFNMKKRYMNADILLNSEELLLGKEDAKLENLLYKNYFLVARNALCYPLAIEVFMVYLQDKNKGLELLYKLLETNYYKGDKGVYEYIKGLGINRGEHLSEYCRYLHDEESTAFKRQI